MKKRLVLLVILAAFLAACGESISYGEPYTVTASVSAYTDCDYGMRCDGITKSGRKTTTGTLACGRNVPLGSKVDIPDWGTGRCWDWGSAITDQHIDIWFADRNDALKWGRKTLVVTIYPASESPGHDRAAKQQVAGNAAGQSADGTYTVTKGDTLNGIASSFDTCVSRLAKANNIEDPNRIYPGQVLKITGRCN